MLRTVMGDRRITRDRLRRRRVICTAATGAFGELLDISLPALRAYARRQWFDLVIVRHDTAHGRPAAWGKIPIVARLLDAYEVVVWLDADTIVVNPSRSIAHELRPGKDLYLVEHYNPHDAERTANTGVMMLRSSDWTRQLLAAVWVHTNRIDHPWWENAAMMDLLGYRIPPEHRPAQPHHWTSWRSRFHPLDVAYNSIPHLMPAPAPVINHYAGLPFEVRRPLMLADLEGLSDRSGRRRRFHVLSPTYRSREDPTGGSAGSDDAFASRARATRCPSGMAEPPVHMSSKPRGMRVIEDAPVWMSVNERLLLYALVLGVRPVRCLEIGTFRGGSALIMTAALDDVGAGRLVCVDPSPQMTPAHWAQIEHRAKMLVGPSPTVLGQARDAAGGPFDFVLVDGDHTREGVIADVEGILPLLADDAHVLLHDAHYFEVADAIDRVLELHPSLIDCGLVSTERTPGPESPGGFPVIWGGLRLLRYRHR
jgi:predicted O-methyltransferase YrrM